MKTITAADLRRMTRRGRNKYNVAAKERRTADGIVFDSRKEMLRYQELKALKASGSVLYFLRQVPFDLPGGTKYRADFVVFWCDDDVTIEDVKGHRTAAYKRAKKQVEALYPVEILEV